MGLYAFVHFGPNTFSGLEWGHGTEDPRSFNPTELDCRQWARAFKSAGMTGVIITAKHHDGFCLWPSKFSTHTVAQSGWKEGKGDVLRELSAACRAEGLKMGVYLSPWDRNHPAYGTPQYNAIFASMLEEVLTGYGPIFEVWFDGANGEGPNGKRQEYDWKLFVDTVRKHQPKAVIFSDAGPDIRWVGNEAGYASETNWNSLHRSRYVPGTPLYAELGEGQEDGPDWVPAECDVSIRPGWFWRASEDEKVKPLEQLLDIWYGSVGRGSNLLLNVPPDSRGLIAESDVARLAELGAVLRSEFSKPIRISKAISDGSWEDGFGPEKAVDGREETYWAGARNSRSGELTITLPQCSEFTRIEIREPIELGQRVRRFDVQAETSHGWRTIARGTTIGNRRLFRIEPVSAKRVRLRVLASRSVPLISEFRLFRTP